MWLSRFSRAFASWRANGINSERSAEPTPARFNRSAAGTELLIPTPSSVVSHMEPPNFLNVAALERELEYWSVGDLTESVNPILHYSNTPSLQFPYRQFSFTQLTISIRLANQTSENDLAYLMASS